MSRKRRRSLPAPVDVAEPTAEPTGASIEIEPDADEALSHGVKRAIAPTSEDALAIRRLRNRLIEKLFTPDRSLDS